MQCSKIEKLRQSCDSFYVDNLQETPFVCTTTIDIFLCTANVNFCLPYCKQNLLYKQLHLVTFIFIIVSLLTMSV